jgi:hypothetical protein
VDFVNAPISGERLTVDSTTGALTATSFSLPNSGMPSSLIWNKRTDKAQRLLTLTKQQPNIACDSPVSSQPYALTNVPDLIPMINACDATTMGAEPRFVARVRNMGGQPYNGTTTVQFTLTIDGPPGVPGSQRETVPLQVSGPGWSCIASECTTQQSVAAGAELPLLQLSSAPTIPVDRRNRDVRMNIFTAAGEQANNNSTETLTDLSSDSVADLVPTVSANSIPAIGGQVDFSVQIRNAGTSAYVGTTSVGFSSALALTGTGLGWVCSGATCTYTADVLPGTDIPLLTLSGLIGNDTGPSVVVSLTTVAKERRSNNSFVTTVSPIGKDLASASLIGGSVSASTGGLQSGGTTNAVIRLLTPDIIVSGTLLVRIDAPIGILIESASGAGWTCGPVQGFRADCTYPSSLTPGVALPVLTVGVRETQPTLFGIAKVLSVHANAPNDTRVAISAFSTTLSVIEQALFGVAIILAGPGVQGGTVDGIALVRAPAGGKTPPFGLQVSLTTSFAERFVGPPEASGWICTSSSSAVFEIGSLLCLFSRAIPSDGVLPPVPFRFRIPLVADPANRSTRFLVGTSDSTLYSDFQFGYAA